ncbi:MAG: DegT/DnrJ/EryC1/StrS family aminotransferase [Candidatus Kerfeldbacteria bacterium]|nr:DegT/DnrJ/EryC1/StrS family aminotransferase [Candidatus Kerfeldbacteria bacterium]
MRNIQYFSNKVNKHIIDNAEVRRVTEVLRTGLLSKPDGGPVVGELQRRLSKLLNMKYVFAVTSGTAALHSAIVALGLKPGDEVIVPALANIADCSVVLQVGAKPVFADVDQLDFNVAPESIKAKISKRTKAIIAVHMYGQPAKMNEIKNLAKRHKLVLIEDCAQAAGAKYHGKHVGSFGDIGCFSLYQTKHIVAGEGGVVATNNKKFAGIITSIANNGIMKANLDAYDYDKVGFNYQMTELQAALALVQLKKLDRNNRARRKNAGVYISKLSKLGIQFQKVNKGTENSYFYLTGLLPERFASKRDALLDQVKERGVPIKKLYPLALTEITLMKHRVPHNCPIAQSLTKRLFNLFVNPGLEKDDINFMAETIKACYKQLST